MSPVGPTVLVAAALIAAQPIQARDQPFIASRAIEAAVADFAGIHPRDVRPVDARLRLAACGAPLALDWHDQARSTVVVRCPGRGGWRLFVGVSAGPPNAAGTVNAISRGDRITIRFAGRGFAVTASGRALTGGNVGDAISIRPDGGNTVLLADVHSASVVVARPSP